MRTEKATKFFEHGETACSAAVLGEVDWNQFKHLRQIGLDEISLLKGRGDYVTIVSTRDDQGKPVVPAMLKDRKDC